MKHKRYVQVPGCPVEVTLDLLQGRWKGVVLHQLVSLRCLRFNELHRRLPGITPRLLTKQLRELQEAGLIERISSADGPVRVEYRPTEEGDSLRPIIDALASWGEARLRRRQLA